MLLFLTSQAGTPTQWLSQSHKGQPGSTTLHRVLVPLTRGVKITLLPPPLFPWLQVLSWGSPYRGPQSFQGLVPREAHRNNCGHTVLWWGVSCCTCRTRATGARQDEGVCKICGRGREECLQGWMEALPHPGTHLCLPGSSMCDMTQFMAASAPLLPV